MIEPKAWAICQYIGPGDGGYLDDSLIDNTDAVYDSHPDYLMREIDPTEAQIDDQDLGSVL